MGYEVMGSSRHSCRALHYNYITSHLVTLHCQDNNMCYHDFDQLKILICANAKGSITFLVKFYTHFYFNAQLGINSNLI